MKRTAATIFAVCLVSLFLAGFELPGFAWTGLLDWTSPTYAVCMMLVDTIAAAVVLIRPAGKAQALVGVTYLVQIGFYAGRLLNGENADINNLWLGLTVMAMLQLVLVGGWWIYERVTWGDTVHRRDPVPVTSHHKSDAG